jgi:hypothetical protein
MIQQLMFGDRLTKRHEARQPALHRVVEAKSSLSDQLQDERRGEGLCHTSDAHTAWTPSPGCA